jgi:hypothetical protein
MSLQTQGREWVGFLFGLLGWDAFDDCRGDCFVYLYCLPGKLYFDSVELCNYCLATRGRLVQTAAYAWRVLLESTRSAAGVSRARTVERGHTML